MNREGRDGVRRFDRAAQSTKRFAQAPDWSAFASQRREVTIRTSLIASDGLTVVSLAGTKLKTFGQTDCFRPQCKIASVSNRQEFRLTVARSVADTGGSKSAIEFLLGAGLRLARIGLSGSRTLAR